METLSGIFEFWKDTVLGLIGSKPPQQIIKSVAPTNQPQAAVWQVPTFGVADNLNAVQVPLRPEVAKDGTAAGPDVSTPIASSDTTTHISSPIKLNSTTNAFNPNKIISDKEFLDCSSMTEKQIQDFLEFKGSYLKDFKVAGALPSYWIYKHCNDFGLNAKVLMTNIQKEQASITAKTLPKNKRRLDYFCGVGAYDPPRGDDPKWAGIDKQILGSVQVNVKRYNNAVKLKFPYSYTTDKPEFRKLQISNAATRSLYSYTPFVGDQTVIIGKNKYDAPFGNKLFWYIYNRWFGFVE